jgi:hypothetical protein
MEPDFERGYRYLEMTYFSLEAVSRDPPVMEMSI